MIYITYRGTLIWLTPDSFLKQWRPKGSGMTYSKCQKKKKKICQTSLAVQGLRLCTSNTGGVGLIPGWGTKIPHSSQKKKKKEKNCQARILYPAKLSYKNQRQNKDIPRQRQREFIAGKPDSQKNSKGCHSGLKEMTPEVSWKQKKK